MDNWPSETSLLSLAHFRANNLLTSHASRFAPGAALIPPSRGGRRAPRPSPRKTSAQTLAAQALLDAPATISQSPPAHQSPPRDFRLPRRPGLPSNLQAALYFAAAYLA